MVSKNQKPLVVNSLVNYQSQFQNLNKSSWRWILWKLYADLRDSKLHHMWYDFEPFISSNSFAFGKTKYELKYQLCLLKKGSVAWKSGVRASKNVKAKII